MNRSLRATCALLLALLVMACAFVVPATPGAPGTQAGATATRRPTGTPRPTAPPPPYDEAADAKADIAAALTAAQGDGKYVLLDFGANWCPDCIALATFFEDPEIRAFLDAHYHVVSIDVGEWDRNLDIAEQYGNPIEAGIPAVVILNPDGDIVTTTNDGAMANARSATKEEILAYLQKWAPGVAPLALATFEKHSVRVTLALEWDPTGAAVLAGTFTPLKALHHLYSIDLASGGIEGAGRPTRIDLPPGCALAVRGPLVADQPLHEVRFAGFDQPFPVYPDGPVTLRLPVELPQGTGSAVATTVSITYMACSSEGRCMPPVAEQLVAVTVPTG